jgi:uncharacterized protein YbcI
MTWPAPPSLAGLGVRQPMPSNTLPGEQLAAITREMVRIKSQHFGKGATEAKTYQCDGFLFCVMKGGLTTAERNLLEHGDSDLVRQVRLRFQHHNGAAFRRAVERITRRPVLGYESQVIFDPDYVVEMFVLGDADLEAEKTA